MKVSSFRSLLVAATAVSTATTSYASNADYNAGDFTISVNNDAGSIAIHNGNGDEVWQSPDDRAFISASSGLTDFPQASGNFQIDCTKVSAPCANATISNVQKSNDSTVELSGGFSDESCASWTWMLNFSSDAEGALKFFASVNGDGVDNVHIAYKSPREEAFFGLGEQTGIGNLRGWKIPIWTREGGVGRGEEPVTTYLNSDASISGAYAGGSLRTTYTAIASMVSSLGRWIVLDGTMYALFDLASNSSSDPFRDTIEAYLDGEIHEGDYADSSSSTVEIMYEGTSVGGSLGVEAAGNKMLDASGALTEVTGRQPELPDWIHDGAVLGIQGGQEKVEGIIQDALNSSMPLVSVWLQDWCGTRLQEGLYGIDLKRLWWNWENDETLYPTWADWVPHLQSTYGVRTMSYVNTFLANVSNKDTGYRTNFYKMALEGGRFAENATANDGSAWTITSGPGIDAGLLDISNQTTVDWFKELVKEQFYSVPISGAMQDFGEYLVVDDTIRLSSGQVNPRQFHNAYPAVWAQILREVTEELDIQDETVGFHRSAATFSAKHQNLFWVGDQNIDESREDGMRAVISSTFHAGSSGWAQAHSDIGGYTNTLAPDFNITRSAALLGRWGEMGAFSGAAFRTHEGNIPSVNAQAYTNDSTVAYHAYNAQLFRALKPYRKALLGDYHEKGWPMVRHPIVYAPEDEQARSIIDETFWMGEALFVAPVYDMAATSLEVYLPPIEINSNGSAVADDVMYKHLWTGEMYQPGDTVQVDTPWGKPGVFMRWPLTEDEGMQLQQLVEFNWTTADVALTA